MKKIQIKRLVYIGNCGESYIGGVEYDSALSDANILGSVHEVGKTEWIGNILWLLRDGVPSFRITVQPFTQYQKSWYDYLIDTIRRI
jgi:hypothetical protein